MAHTRIATSPGVSAETISALSSPASVPSPFGPLEFFDGLPLPATVAASYGALDLLRGIDVYLNCVPGASTVAIRRGFRSVGAATAQVICYTDPRLDSAELVLTGNTETTYGTTFLDLAADGPTVIEPPTNSLCLVNDFWQRWVADMGLAGPDQGRGGKYLFLPPGYDGTVPEGFFVYRTPTFTNWLVVRALGGIDSLKTTRIYPLTASDNPPEMEFINTSGADFNTIHTNDFSYFEELNTLVQEEPTTALDPERAGQLAAIGIVKGQPFAPDERARRILDTAARVAAGIARTLVFKPRDPQAYYYPNSSWKTPFVGGSHEFLIDGARLLDARTMFHYFAAVVSPAMAAASVGVGSQYAFTAEDATGAWLDGSRNYTLTLPAGIPAKNFWAIDIYDPQTRSLLRTDTPYPSLNGLHGDVQAEANGDTILSFGPTARADRAGNWLQTIPGKGWFPVLRLYGPLESWFDKSWRPGEIEPAG